MMADGVNFDGAVTDSVMNDNYLRNTGDDALATWSNGTPNARNSIGRPLAGSVSPLAVALY